jgi:hypothetical protein
LTIDDSYGLSLSIAIPDVDNAGIIDVDPPALLEDSTRPIFQQCFALESPRNGVVRAG